MNTTERQQDTNFQPNDAEVKEKIEFPLGFPESYSDSVSTPAEIMHLAGLSEESYEVSKEKIFFSRGSKAGKWDRDNREYHEQATSDRYSMIRKNSDGCWEISQAAWENPLADEVQSGQIVRPGALRTILDEEKYVRILGEAREIRKKAISDYRRKIYEFITKLRELKEFPSFPKDLKDMVDVFEDEMRSRTGLLLDIDELKIKLQAEWDKAHGVSLEKEDVMKKIRVFLESSPVLKLSSDVIGSITFEDLSSPKGWSAFSCENMGEINLRFGHDLPNNLNAESWVEIPGETDHAQIVDRYSIPGGELQFLAFKKYGGMNLRVRIASDEKKAKSRIIKVDSDPDQNQHISKWVIKKVNLAIEIPEMPIAQKQIIKLEPETRPDEMISESVVEKQEKSALSEQKIKMTKETLAERLNNALLLSKVAASAKENNNAQQKKKLPQLIDNANQLVTEIESAINNLKDVEDERSKSSKI